MSSLQARPPRGRRRTAPLTLLALIVALSLTPLAVSAQTPETAGIAWLRAANLAGDAEPLQLILDGHVLASDLGFGAGTAYSALSAGRHRVRILAGGTTVLDAAPNLRSGQNYTYSVQGLLDGGIVAVLAEDDTTPVARRRTRVRFGNALPNDLTVQARLRGAARFHATAPLALSDYEEVPAGTYTLEITTPEGQLLLSIPGVALAPGAVCTLYATGLNTVSTATTPAQAGRVVVSSAQGAQISGTAATAPTAQAGALQLVNLVGTAADAPPSVSIDGQAVLGPAGFGSVTGLPLTAGDHHLQVSRRTGGPALIDRTITVARAATTILLLHRVAGATVGTIVASSPPPSLPAGMARVRFGNASPQGKALGATLAGEVTFPATAAGNVTGYHEAPSGTYLVQSTGADGTPLAGGLTLSIAGGQSLTLLAAGTGEAGRAAPVLAVSQAGGQFLTPPVAAAGR